MDISFVILTFNSEKYIDRCLASIHRKCTDENLRYESIVVDNGSTDRTHDLVMTAPGEVKLIENRWNEGTTRPRNKGLRASSGKVISFLDSDTELLRGSVKAVCDKLIEDSGIGIIAPKLLLPDGSTQRSAKRFPLPQEKFLKALPILFGVKLPVSEFYSSLPEGPVTVANAISACWFFRKSVVEEIGYLDENIFYSPEDLDYCLRAWKAGRAVLYWPSLQVRHHTQQITHKSPFNRISLSHMKGLLYFYRKHRFFLTRPKYGEWET